jgi:hypothetical protein
VKFPDRLYLHCIKVRLAVKKGGMGRFVGSRHVTGSGNVLSK